MSITDKTTTDPVAETQKTAPAPRRSFWAGRSELIVVALVLSVAVFLTVNTITMDVAGDSVPGPQFFPTIICVLLYVMAGALAFQILRRPADRAGTLDDGTGPDADGDATAADRTADVEPAKSARPKTYTDWKTVGLLVGSIVLFILLLPIAGWILSAAFLFWMVCFALGSKRRLFDASLAILFASAIQLAFNALLGLNLPSGFLEGVL